MRARSSRRPGPPLACRAAQALPAVVALTLVLLAARAAVPASAHAADLFPVDDWLGGGLKKAGDVVLGPLKFGAEQIARLLVTIVGALADLLVPKSLVRAGVDAIRWLVQLPPLGQQFDARARARRSEAVRMPHLAQLRSVLTWVGLTLLPLGLVVSGGRAVLAPTVGGESPSEVFGRVIVAGVALLAYDWAWGAATRALAPGHRRAARAAVGHRRGREDAPDAGDRRRRRLGGRVGVRGPRVDRRSPATALLGLLLVRVGLRDRRRAAVRPRRPRARAVGDGVRVAAAVRLADRRHGGVRAAGAVGDRVLHRRGADARRRHRDRAWRVRRVRRAAVQRRRRAGGLLGRDQARPGRVPARRRRARARSRRCRPRAPAGRPAPAVRRRRRDAGARAERDARRVGALLAEPPRRAARRRRRRSRAPGATRSGTRSAPRRPPAIRCDGRCRPRARRPARCARRWATPAPPRQPPPTPHAAASRSATRPSATAGASARAAPTTATPATGPESAPAVDGGTRAPPRRLRRSHRAVGARPAAGRRARPARAHAAAPGPQPAAAGSPQRRATAR